MSTSGHQDGSTRLLNLLALCHVLCIYLSLCTPKISGSALVPPPRNRSMFFGSQFSLFHRYSFGASLSERDMEKHAYRILCLVAVAM